MSTNRDTRVVEVHAAITGTKVTLTFHQWWYRLGSTRPEERLTRIVRATVPVPLTNDDLIKYAEAMARFCVDPKHRAFRAPNALVWREIAAGGPATTEHGEERDGRPFPQATQEPLEGLTDADLGSTVKPAAQAGGGSAAKRLRSSSKEPTTRTLGKGGFRSLPGG